MKNLGKFLFIALLAILCVNCFTSCERVDAGCEGIKVNLYGSNRGVDDVNLVTGWVWYNPFTTRVYEYPTYVQTVDYKPFSINSKEGTGFTVDPAVLINIEPSKSPVVFKKYRKDMDELVATVIYKYVKDACRIQINKFETDYIVSHREEVEAAVESYFRDILTKEHFELQSMTVGLKIPESIEKAINDKTAAIQNAQAAENKVKVVEAEAKQIVARAQAEAEANRVISASLTPQILEQMRLDKWNGEYPQYVGGNGIQVMKSL